MTYDLYAEGPNVYVPYLLISILFTVLAYCMFPLVFASLRKKPISSRKYSAICFGVNFIVMLVFVLFGSTSAVPYFLWTYIFSSLGKKKLLKKAVLNAVPFSNDVERKPHSDSNLPAETGDAKEQCHSSETGCTNGKKRYCKLCGGIINPSTKKCNDCGKQYFRLPKFKFYLSFWIVFLGLIIIIAGLLFKITEYKTTIDDLQTEISEMNATIDQLNASISELTEASNEKEEKLRRFRSLSDMYLSEKNELKQTVDFFNKHVVFVPDDGYRMYHKYGCLLFDDSYFWAYNVEKAQQLGYSPCWLCCK